MPRADIDFTGTDGGGGYLKKGTYHARLDRVEEKDGREFPLWVWWFRSVEGETAGNQSNITTSLSPKAAFFIRQIIEALGAEVPSSLARINTDNYLGNEAMIFVDIDPQNPTFTGKDGQEHDSYKILRVFPVVDGASAPKAAAKWADDDPGPEPTAADLRRTAAVGKDDIPFD